MRSGKALALSVSLALLGAVAYADLAPWIQHQPVGSVLDVLLRSMPLPGGPVRFRRPPSETRPALTKLIAGNPKDAALYRLRAHEAEMQLDFMAAESDWKTYTGLVPDRGEGYLELADYYHRRARGAEEVGALQTLGTLSENDKFAPVPLQRSWQAYVRMLPVIKDAGLPAAATSAAFRSWIARYPKEPLPRQEFVSFLLTQKQYGGAEAQIAAYTRAFPEDTTYPVEARANIAANQSSKDAAIQVYDKAFQPLWPKSLLDGYFHLLDENGQLREFLGRARTAREKSPQDLDATGRLFAYYQHANNVSAARRTLLEYRLAKESKPGSWTPAELRTLAQLFRQLSDANEQARALYALYSSAGATPDDREAALSGIIALLLEKPEEPIRFGSSDLSLYKDIGTADSSPGFLNGILSLVLNSTSPRSQYEQQNAGASAYFHRAEGAKLLDLMEKQFPASTHRTELRSSLIDAYASYGDDDAVITTARTFLTAFPKSTERTHVALALADALARHQRTQEEFTVYQQMLTELAARAEGMPLGLYSVKPAGNDPAVETQATTRPRSPDYAQILDKYLARLSALRRPMEALRVYRRELDRNPNDPGLYERFAGFLEQNNLGADVQDVYRKAIGKFADRTWYDKLARWYLRTKQQDAFTAITREATGIFTGTELETYFGQVVQPDVMGGALGLQLNLYAHQRFPEDMVFVHNLLNRYDAQGNSGAASAQALLHDYWFYDDNVKRRYFERLFSNGELLNQIGSLRRDHPEIQAGQWPQLAIANPAALQFNAEAEAWLSHFEAAAPAVRATADLYPGSLEKNEVASSVYRSLAAYYPADTQVAASFAQKAYDSDPTNTKLLETVGDVYADKEDFAEATKVWSTIPRVFPGKPDGYIEAATVFWDYYRFGNSLALIRDARTKYRDASLYAFESGVIEEGQHDYARAVQHYLTGSNANSQEARTRLLLLATRPAQRDLIYRATADADAELRIEVLRAQQRKPELEAYLAKGIAVATQISALTPLVNAAREEGFESVQRQGLEREVAVTLDPVERMRLRIELAKYFESQKDIPAAARTFDALYRDNPMVLGVLRARVDFDTRNKRDDDAVSALTEAAGNARADLSAQFRFEAARIATNAGRIDQARGLLAGLLKTDPYRSDYLAQMAETYSAANDDEGFLRFAKTEIDALKKAPLPAEDRKSRISALQRRLIVTLARRNDYAAAVDQYIEVVNAYPEDSNVTREAALFAAAHGRKEQLISFYRKTIAAAPRDWRWPIVLARLDTAMEDYPAALEAYDIAMKARPDRADLVQARAELEQRLLRFEDAIKSYNRLYQLTYNDPQWLDKAAEFQARLGQGAAAVATLERAHIGAGGETVSGLFAIADYLDQWHLTTDAGRYAQRGFALAGKDLATQYPSLLDVYAKIMAAARRNDAILSLGPKQVNAIRGAGTRIATLYTPEEKASLAAMKGVGPVLAQTAGLEDNLAQLLSRHLSPAEWISLQFKRGLYEQLSRELEARAPRSNEAAVLLTQAADASAKVGDTASEIRIFARMQASGLLQADSLNRYLILLLVHDPKALVAQKSDQAAQAAIAAGNPQVAMDALRARAAALPPVWLSAYTALTGVYFDDHSPAVNQAFLATLHPQTIGQRIAAKPDATRALVGSGWYYYGARFGEYLARGGAANANDYLPSDLEENPGNPEAYLSLARFDVDTKLFPNAIGEFRKALDLDADRGEAHDGIARVLMQQGRRADAILEWREAIAAFQREQSKGVRVRETFWTNVSAAITAMADAKVFAELQPDVHRLLADYVNRNAGYRVAELFSPILDASYRSNLGSDWLLDIAMQTNGMWVYEFTEDQNEQEWLARFRLAYALRQAVVQPGLNAIGSRQELIKLLLRGGKNSEALAEWRKFLPTELENPSGELVILQLRIAGLEGTMDRLISRYKSSPQTAPQMQQLLEASTALRQDGHIPAALALLEFAYTRELDAQHLEIANFLGLARVYLERGNQLPQALATLRRMTLIAGLPFEGFEPAGDLLLEFHHDPEAKEFFAKAVQATPWDAQSKLKLGQGASEVVIDATAPYRLRADAARLIAPGNAAATGELALLAFGNIPADAARKPFYVESRLAAAATASDPALKLSLLREALAIAPDDPRVRLAAVHAALNAHRDRLALAIYQQDQQQPPMISDAALLKELSAAAERTGDLATALVYLKGQDSQHFAAIQAEQRRRAANAIRRPVVSDKTQQTQIVGPREVNAGIRP